MKFFSTVSAFALLTALGATQAMADAPLSGSIKTKDGAPMAGVTVSAKMDGTPITTTVFTDQAGRYFFPDMPEGKYRVWAQAIAYEPAKGEVELKAAKSQNFTMQSTKDFVPQLPGDEILAALPETTADDARMKTFIRKTCTGCHTAAYPLQHKFDETGWNAILDAMKRFNVLGVYRENEINPSIDAHQAELARYLARARGPGETSMNFNLRTRPTGEAARAVYREYDVPLDPDLKLPGTFYEHDGADWSKGTPSGMFGGYGVHDAEADLDGNIWFTHSWPSRTVTVGRIDAKTGAYKAVKIAEPNGFASQTHGIVRDQKGFLWFNTRPGASPGGNPTGLAKLDPKTEAVKVYTPPKPMSGTAGTLDVDPKGFVWVTSPDGVLRFDPEKESFVEMKSVTYKTPQGVGTVYGTAADAAGNGWWLDMKFDRVQKGDPNTGQTVEIQLPPVQAEKDRLTPDEKALYAKYVVPDFNTPYPWAQGARRMGGDKNPDGEFVYVGNSFGGNLARINIKTNKVDLIPLPNPDTMQPYQVTIDKGHNVWTNLWSTDSIARYNPANSQWTVFDLPSRGTETRYISLLEKDGRMQVVLPYSRTRRVAVMTVRSEADMQAAATRAAPDFLELELAMHIMKIIVAAALFSVAGVAAQADIASDWATIKAPEMPPVQKVTADPKTTALLVMDFMKTSCTEQTRPRCAASVGPVKKLLDEARAKGVTIIYTVTGNEATMANFLPELASKPGEPILPARADKFLNPDLDKTLKEKGIKTVIPVGTAANGAVLYTATGAAYRNYDVLVPIDGLSGSSPYSEQITVWQLVNGPQLADRVKLTKTDMISF